jgi:putative toxin-antitoxin system antitoxin component (TIGR02293 family)
MELSAVTKVLGGKKVLRQNIETRMDLIDLSNRGVTKDALAHLAEYFSCSINEMARLLPVTVRTVQRYASRKPFNRMVSEQILQIAEVGAKGSEVFGGKDRFLVWMHHPNKVLSNKTPMSLLNSKFGADMVMDELGRIEHGVYS